MKIYTAHPTSERRVQKRSAYSLTLLIVSRCPGFMALPVPFFSRAAYFSTTDRSPTRTGWVCCLLPTHPDNLRANPI